MVKRLRFKEALIGLMNQVFILGLGLLMLTLMTMNLSQSLIFMAAIPRKSKMV